MKNIKIIVATHKKATMPTDTNLYLPIHVGRKGKEDLGYTGDHTGDNISHLNPYYCELTGLYWAWKNLDCDYLGLAHYRRYLTNKKAPYREGVSVDDVVLNQQQLDALLEAADVLVPSKRRYYIETLYSHYSNTHDENHLVVTREILKELYPQDVAVFDTVMQQRSGYMFNMFVMKKELADAYCQWLFPVVDELYQRLDITGYSAFDARLFGRISERLFNVWLTKKQLTVKEVPFMYLENVDLWRKGSSFLKAKFFGKKYGSSF